MKMPPAKNGNYLIIIQTKILKKTFLCVYFFCSLTIRNTLFGFLFMTFVCMIMCLNVFFMCVFNTHLTYVKNLTAFFYAFYKMHVCVSVCVCDLDFCMFVHFLNCQLLS